MNHLVLVKGNEVFTDSLVIARGTGNRHKNVKELIVKYSADLADFGKVSVLNVTLETNGGKQEGTLYQLNEEQAVFLMTLLRNTKQVVAFKKELVRQFYEMRRFILQRQTSEWQETRKVGKLTRRAETDIIQKLVAYAESQGSKNSDKLYMVYSKLAKKIIGISDRDASTVSQLNNLSLAENIILHCIEAGMEEGKHYKEIYKDSKARLELFKDIAFLKAG